MIYAISDIHGQYDLYVKMLNKISFSDNDTLYVLGDVVDRGNKPMEVLFDMMQRKNVKPLLGNHDNRMLEVLLEHDLKSLKEAEVIRNEDPLMDGWLCDGGKTTISEYCVLEEEKKKEVIEYLKTFQLIDAVTAGNKKYLLAHTVPSKEKMQNLSDTNVYDFTWGTVQYDRRYFDDIDIITGHTPTALIDSEFKGRILRMNGHINIDCGAYFTGTLGCLCLDDLSEYYVGKWHGMSYPEIVMKVTGADTVYEDQPLYEILNVDPDRFSKLPFGYLELSVRAFNCLNRYLNSPFASCEPGFVARESVSDLLKMTISQYQNVRNLGINAFGEVMEKLAYVSAGIMRNE